MATTRGAPWALQRTSHQTWAADEISGIAHIISWSQIYPSMLGLRKVYPMMKSYISWCNTTVFHFSGVFDSSKFRTVSPYTSLGPWWDPGDILRMGYVLPIWMIRKSPWKSCFCFITAGNHQRKSQQAMNHRWAKKLLHLILVQHQLPQLLHLVQALGLGRGQFSIHDARGVERENIMNHIRI